MSEDFWIHCGKCGHERVICQTPVPVDVFVVVAKLPCVACRAKKKILMSRKPKPTEPGRYEAWLRNGDTGISSETIWSVMTGRRISRSYWHADVPHDPDDFGRCYRLLQVMPEWRARLPEVAAEYPGWKPLVDAWDELTAIYEQEVPNHTGSAPKLYARMQALLRDEA